MKTCLMHIWNLMKAAYFMALFVLAYGYVSDSIAFHNGMFQLQEMQTKALITIARGLHGT